MHHNQKSELGTVLYAILVQLWFWRGITVTTAYNYIYMCCNAGRGYVQRAGLPGGGESMQQLPRAGVGHSCNS